MVDNVLLLQPCSTCLLYPHNSTSSMCGRDNDFLCCFQSSCGQSPAARPCCFPPLSHRDALIIYPNNQRVNPLFKEFSTFFITFLPDYNSTRHRHISEHIFDNSLSITAYQYSNIDRSIPIKSYRYNYIDTGLPIRGV